MKVFRCDPKANYSGMALVAANTAEEANKVVEAFKACDYFNTADSHGYGKIYDDDCIPYLTANYNYPEIILYGIFYSG